MATKSPPADAMSRALRSVNVDPELAFQAVEETRNAAGENVIAAISAQIANLQTAMQVGFAELNGRIDALEGRVETVMKIVWPLVIGILGAMTATLYKVFWP